MCSPFYLNAAVLGLASGQYPSGDRRYCSKAKAKAKSMAEEEGSWHPGTRPHTRTPVEDTAPVPDARSTSVTGVTNIPSLWPLSWPCMLYCAFLGVNARETSRDVENL